MTRRLIASYLMLFAVITGGILFSVVDRHSGLEKSVFGIARAQVVGCGGGMISGGCGGGPAPIPNLIVNNGLPNWQACRNKVTSGASNCNVLILGESTDTGYNGTYSSATDDATSGSWVRQLAFLLRSNYGINANANSLSGDRNTGTVAALNAFDNRAVLHNWNLLNGSGFSYTFGGFSWISGDTTAYAFTPTDAGYSQSTAVITDTLDVYTYNQPGNGTITVASSAGGTNCTINTNSANAFAKTSCPFTSGNATYSATTASAFCCIIGTVVARLSTQKEISLINGAFNGATVEQATTSSASTCGKSAGAFCPWDLPSQIAAFSPGLVIIGYGGNDSTSQATVTATFNGTTTMNVTAVGSGSLAVGDVVSNGTFPITIPANTQIVSLGTGTGGTGTYILNNVVSSQSGLATDIGTPVATFIANLTTIANAAKTAGADVLFNYGTGGPYTAGVVALAASLGAPAYNFGWTFTSPSGELPIAASWLVLPGGTWDFNHRGASGQMAYASALAQILAQ